MCLRHVLTMINQADPRPAYQTPGAQDVQPASRMWARSARPPGGAAWLDLALVVGAGLIAGAFLSRLIAESPWLAWPLYRRGPAAALTILGGAAFAAIWWAHRRRQQAPRALSSSKGSGASQGFGAGIARGFVPFYILVLYLAQPTPDLLQAAILLAGALSLSAIQSLRNLSLPDWSIAMLLFALCLGAYLRTLTPAVGTRDGYELQAISATLGFAHPTGYPLFPILGRLWIAIFPFGSIAWRINVLCALFAAGSIPLLYATAQRVLRARSFAVLSALLLAFSQTLWAQASRPEKYTLNALFVSAILYLAFGKVNPEQRLPYPHLRWLGFVYGLSLTHHRTMLMLAPALGLYIIWRDPTLFKRPKEWGAALAIALAPLLIYLYIPWRAAAQNWTMTLSEFFQYISGSYYSAAVRPWDWLSPERAQMFWRFLTVQFGEIGVALGILGLINLGIARRWRFLTCTILAYFCYYVWGTVWYAYYNDVNSFIPNHIIMATWIGGGVQMLWQAIFTRPRRRQVVPQGAFWSAAALLPMWLIWSNGPQVDASHEWNLTRWGEYAISQDIAASATILADREKYPPLDYFARVERWRPDLQVVILDNEQAYLDRLTWDLAQGRHVYLARFLPGLEGRFHLRSVGPLVEVSTEPVTNGLAGLAQGEPLASWPVDSRETIRLLACAVEAPATPFAQGPLRVTLTWQAVSPVSVNYQANLRLVSAAGQVWWQTGDHPVNGMYPTAAWKPDEIITDWHEIDAVQAIPPGEYTLEVGLFPPFSSQGLPAANGTTWLALEHHTIQPADVTHITHLLRAIQPGQWQLVGYDLPSQAPPTGRAVLVLYWQALAPLPDLEIGVRLVSSGNEGWTWQQPARGEYPTSQWTPGKTIATAQSLVMPEAEGPATVEIALRPHSVGSAAAPIAFYPRWLAAQSEKLTLPPLAVQGHSPAAPGTVNFGDQILLLDTDMAERTLQPGDLLDIAMRWQCMQAMDRDYTLFIQLLGPDGTPKGQIDVWPQNGTLPTSKWREGQIISDVYQVYLNPDAPPGDYQVAVGWYLLETMQRLPVLNPAGNAVDDKVLLPGLTVAP
jgi:hypothetical protein